MDLDTVRLVDHLLAPPSKPLALAGEDLENWEPLDPPAPPLRSFWRPFAAAAVLLLLLA